MIEHDNSDWLVERRPVPVKHSLSLLPLIYVERGTKEDWDLLHELHYKAENNGIGPRVYRAILNGQVIGVGVMTVPKMLLSGRNDVFKHLKPNVNGRDTRLINRHRAIWINAMTCTNSRLVLDTIYRGAGIAYRMQNLMMRMTGCRYVEFQSSMSKFNPFALRAGMRFSKPRRSSNYVKGLEFFRGWFACNPSDFVGVMQELNDMPAAARNRCIAKMRAFYYRCSAMEKSGDNRANGTSRVDGMSVDYLLKSLIQLVFASPLYGVFENPDFDLHAEKGTTLPARLPLIAFDNQPLTSQLDVTKALKQLAVIEATTQLIDLDWVDPNFTEDKEEDATAI